MPAAIGRSPRSWLMVCDEFAVANTVPRDLFELLFSFRPAPSRGSTPAPEPTIAGDFDELERTLLAADLSVEVGPALAAEVDGPQAELFASRIASVDRALAQLADACGRLLRVGLRQRLTGILAGPGPRATRVRALADFYTSQLGRHRARSTTGPTLADYVAKLDWQPVATGVEHARMAGPTSEGPIHINVLRVDPSQVRLAVHDRRTAANDGQNLDQWATELGAIAAVSGGFFLYSEPDIEAPDARFDPVGLLLADGQVVSAPVFRRGALTIDDNGHVAIDRLGLEAASLVIATSVGGLELDGQQAWNRAHGRIGPGVPSATIVGDRVIAVGRSLAIPLNGFAIPLGPGPTPEVGDAVRYAPILGARGVPLRSAIAGGPMLVEHGRPTLDLDREEFMGSAPPVTFSQDETHDRNLLPRLAVGLDGSDRLVFVAVDGRDLDHGLGMTLAELSTLLIALGCQTATNLDGGASKCMVVRGKSVDLAARARPVQSAVLVFTRE